MMTIRSKLIALLLSVLVSAPISITANGAESIAFPSQEWSFNGPFGTFDRGELQRGLQVYKEVCATCHSLNFISFRNLADLGFNEDEVKAIAAEFQVKDGPNNDGEMFERAAIPSDVWPAPYANDNAARASNNGALPPDLSLMVDARVGGADYIYAVLMGYTEPPADFQLEDGVYYNKYMDGNKIKMSNPLADDLVSYADGTKATQAQMAKDVTTFAI